MSKVSKTDRSIHIPQLGGTLQTFKEKKTYFFQNFFANFNFLYVLLKPYNIKISFKNIDIFNKKTLILVDSFQEDLILSSRNIRNVFIENVKCVSVYDLLDSEIVIIDKIGIGTFSEVLA